MNPNNKENIYSLRGFGKVFRFTLKQTLKNKSFVFTAIVMILMMGMMKPIMYLMSNSAKNSSAVSVNLSDIEADKMIIYNETEFDFDKDMAIAPEVEKGKEGALRSGNVTIYNKGEASEEELISALGEKDILVVIRPEAAAYKVNGIISDQSKVTIRSLDRATEYVQETFTTTRESQMTLDDDSLKAISAGISREGIHTAAEYKDEKSHTMSSGEYMGLTTGFALIIMIVSTLCASYIITSVNEEKQSKLAETLLVSVRPMALLLGKVLGMLTFVMGTIITGVLFSYGVELFMEKVLKVDTSVVGEGGINLAIFTGYGVQGLIIFIAEIILGLLAFGILSGILGSACGRVEDQQNATTIVTFITLIGYMGALFLGTKGDYTMIGAMVPPVSFYMAPAAYIAGRIELWTLLASYAIQCAIVVALMVLAAKTYRNLLLSDSSKPKLQTIFAAARN